MVLVLALLIGVVAGMRTILPLAVVSWAAAAGWLRLDGTQLSFFASTWTLAVATILAIAELVTDKLPMTPSRKTPGPFGARLISGVVAGAALGAAAGQLAGGVIAGAIGAVIGTLGGYWFRSSLVRATGGRDTPVAVLEDVIALVLACAVVFAHAKMTGAA